MSGIRVDRRVVIPEEELGWSFTPSPGPGGQHANKTSTRAGLTWDVSSSRALDPEQRDRLIRALGRRIDSRGVLRVSSSEHRSQLRNREEASRRLAELVREALRPVRTRRPTRPTTAARERRLRTKRRRSDTKRLRRSPGTE